MNCAIITVGTEILIGSILNTNGKYLSERLSDLGVHVSYHVSVRDDFPELMDQITIMLDKVDILFLCGGLGPTEDDMTKEALAKVISRNIILDTNQYNKLLSRFETLGRTMTKNNAKQAMVLDGSYVLDNMWGIAPGEVIDYENKKIILLPGPPKEFIPMVDYYINDFINVEEEIIIKSVNVAGLGESAVEDRIRKLNITDKDITINTFAHFYDTEIKIIGEGFDRNLIESKINNIVSLLYNEFGNYLYAEDNMSIKQLLVDKLIKHNKSISFAESVTGGLLASSITSISGASKIIGGSLVTYSNSSKIKLLNVNEETLDKYGAVSEQTAMEMLKGLRSYNFSDICIVTTGYAGPEPIEDVGTVYVGYSYDINNYNIKKYKFSGDRLSIQKRIANTVFLDILFNIGG